MKMKYYFRFWDFSHYFRYNTISRKILNCGNMASFFAPLNLKKQLTFSGFVELLGPPQNYDKNTCLTDLNHISG